MEPLVEAEMRAADPGSSDSEELTAELKGHRDQLERARTGDSDLAALRQMLEFAGLFAKYDRFPSYPDGIESADGVF